VGNPDASARRREGLQEVNPNDIPQVVGRLEFDHLLLRQRE
jgi:hypothetical protein